MAARQPPMALLNDCGQRTTGSFGTRAPVGQKHFRRFIAGEKIFGIARRTKPLAGATSQQNLSCTGIRKMVAAGGGHFAAAKTHRTRYRRNGRKRRTPRLDANDSFGGISRRCDGAGGYYHRTHPSIAHSSRCGRFADCRRRQIRRFCRKPQTRRKTDDVACVRFVV